MAIDADGSKSTLSLPMVPADPNKIPSKNNFTLVPSLDTATWCQSVDIVPADLLSVILANAPPSIPQS